MDIDTKNIPELTVEMILNAAEEGIFGVDLEGKTTFCNNQAAKLLGYEVKDILHQPQHALIHHKHPDGSLYDREDCPIYAAFSDGQVHSVSDEVFWKKDGTPLPVEYKSSPIFKDDKIIGAVVTFKSIEKELRSEKERNLALSNLRTREKELETILDTVIDGLITIDVNGKIKQMNKAAEKMFGYTSEEVAGKNVKMLMPEPYASEHDGYLNNYLTLGVAKIIGIGREVSGLRKDGSTFPMELGVSEMVTDDTKMFVGITKDLTKLKKAMEGQARLASVVENTDDAVLGILLDGTITLWNRAAKNIFGFSEMEIVGQHISILVPDNYKNEPAYLIESIKRGQVMTNFETKRLRKDGTEIEVALTLSPFHDDHGNIIGISSIARDIRQQKQLIREKEALIEKLEAVTLTDALTGLWNRRGFAQRLDNELARFRRNRRPFSLLLLDIDHFKKINDTYGHAAGDMVLKELSRKFKINMREMDTICRWGGEEFLIMVVETDLAGAKRFAEKIRMAAEGMNINFEGQTISVTLSIGVSEFLKFDTKFDDILKLADKRLYKAKAEGRNRVIST